MEVSMVKITPELAESWLSKNAEFQRKLRPSIVDRYARDMERGEWVSTHQGIAFDCNGRLIDGQHRLAAIVKSGMTIEMPVARNTAARAYDHVDLGFSRKTSDVLKAQGEGWITNEHIAIARLAEFGTDVKKVLVNRSPFELRAIVEAHKNALHFVFQNTARRVRGVTVAPVMAAIVLAYYEEMDRVKLAEFLQLLVSGVSSDPTRDVAVIKLRDWLRDVQSNGNSVARTETLLKTQRVIKAFMNGEKLSKIYTPTEAIYPARRKAGIGV